MARRSWLLLAIFSAASASAAEPRWIRAQSPNFEMYSTASEASVRSTLLEFEEVRSFFQSLTTLDTRKGIPVRIVAFSSPKEFEPYRLNEAAIAYYHAGVEHDCIVMNHIGADTFPVAVHEYFHLEVKHWGLKFPRWLSEGMAVLYSTLRPLPGQTIVGDLIPARLQALGTEKWVPLAVILAVDSSSPYYNEKSKAGSFYNEAWALTHMLYLSPAYRPGFAEFLKAIAAGKDSADALTSVYGKPLKAIEEDLKRYFRGNSFRAVVFPTQIQAANVPIMPEPAPGFDVRLALAELHRELGPNHPDEAAYRRQLQTLAAEQPQRPEPHVLLGYLAWSAPNSQAGQRVPAPIQEEIEKEFATAYALGDHSPRMLWDYGRMMEAKQPKDAVGSFQRLLTIQPDRPDVSVEIASALLNDGQIAEAAKVLMSLPRVMSAEEAPRYFRVAASVTLRLGDRDQARTLAGKLIDTPRSTPADKQWAQRFLDDLK